MLKKIIYIVVFSTLALIIAFQFAYKQVWVSVIDSNKKWSYAVIDSSLSKSPNFFQKIKWNNSLVDTTYELSDKRGSQDVIFQSVIHVNDVQKINQILLEYNNKYSIKLYINENLCYQADRLLLTTETFENKNETINIYKSWSRTKRFLQPEIISPFLIEGENTVSLLVYNLEDVKKFSPKKMSLSFFEKTFITNTENQIALEENRAGEFTSSTFPIFNIQTYNQHIPDEPKIKAELAIISSSTKNLLSDKSEVHQIKIERRGFTSQNFSKKSYGFNIVNDSTSNKASLLGLPEAKKWVLYGPFADKSLIRNVLTYSLFNELGNYASKTKFVELTVNNNYQGVYLLIEKINTSQYHLNLPEFKTNENGAPSGGYLLEIDRNRWESNYPPSSDLKHIPLSYDLYSPKKKAVDSLIQLKIKSQFNLFEENLYSQSDSLFNYMDINSFVDHFIISEFTKNIDAYRLSTYIYNPDITLNTPKFYMGPIWDYNFAYGLTDYNDGYNPKGFIYNCADYVPFWWVKLMKNDQFKETLTQRYFNLRKSILSNNHINQKIDSLYNECKGPAENNFKKWSVLGSKDFWPNYFLGETYEEEINYLKKWIAQRLQFLDETLLYKNLKDPMYYEIQIRNKAEWLEKIKIKAKKRNISLEEMIEKDAKYFSNK